MFRITRLNHRNIFKFIKPSYIRHMSNSCIIHPANYSVINNKYKLLKDFYPMMGGLGGYFFIISNSEVHSYFTNFSYPMLHTCCVYTAGGCLFAIGLMCPKVIFALYGIGTIYAMVDYYDKNTTDNINIDKS